MGRLMWAQQLVAPFWFEKVEVAAPAPNADSLRPGEVSLRLDAAGICGSDLPYFKGGPFPSAVLREGRYVIPPGAPLHEVVGEVVASRDPSLGRGARVVGWASAYDGFAEYVVADGGGLPERRRTLTLIPTSRSRM